MRKNFEGVVMSCASCPEAICVVVHNQVHYECEAIRRMGIKQVADKHSAHHIVVYAEWLFIPDICPMPETDKIGEIYSVNKIERGVQFFIR